MQMRSRSVRFFLSVTLWLAVGPTACAPHASQGSPISTDQRSDRAWCALPVDAVVVDGFRPPPTPWSPGNRGLTFGTRSGQLVRALRAGTIEFSGPIAGHWYVTVRSSERADVTYSFLARASVQVGARVEVGSPLGVTGEVHFHLGERIDGRYVDPTGLLIEACGSPHAVLVAVPPR